MNYKDKYPAIMSGRSRTLAKFGIIDDGLSDIERNAELAKMRKIADGFDTRSELSKAITSRYEAGYYNSLENENEINKSVVDSCKFNILKMLKYFLETKELRKKIDINFNGNEAFIEACKNNNEDIIKYLILGEQINKNEIIEKYLKNNKNNYADMIFKIRDLPEKDSFINKIIKI